MPLVESGFVCPVRAWSPGWVPHLLKSEPSPLSRSLACRLGYRSLQEAADNESAGLGEVLPLDAQQECNWEEGALLFLDGVVDLVGGRFGCVYVSLLLGASIGVEHGGFNPAGMHDRDVNSLASEVSLVCPEDEAQALL